MFVSQSHKVLLDENNKKYYQQKHGHSLDTKVHALMQQTNCRVQDLAQEWIHV